MVLLDPEMPTGKLSIIALKQGSVTPTPVLFQQETSKPTWTTSNTIDSTTTELPLTMSLPSSGLWVLNIYVNEKYYDQFVINATENNKGRRLFQPPSFYLPILYVTNRLTPHLHPCLFKTFSRYFYI